MWYSKNSLHHLYVFIIANDISNVFLVKRTEKNLLHAGQSSQRELHRHNCYVMAKPKRVIAKCFNMVLVPVTAISNNASFL